MSDQDNFNEQDNTYSYKYDDINQGDPVETSGSTGSTGSGTSSDANGSTASGEYNSQQENGYYQWNPYQEAEKKSFFDKMKEKRSHRKSSSHEQRKAEAGGGRFSVKLAKVAAIALVFGLVAGVVFEGASYATGKIIGKDEVEKTTSTISATTGSLNNTSTSTAITVTDVSDIVDQVMPAVVAVTNMTTVQYQNYFGHTSSYESQSAGSGIIISQDEDYIYIATNNHIVSGAETLTITFNDGTSANGAIKGTDPSSDLAVVTVELSDIDSSTMGQIKVATVGDSDDLKVGQSAVVIGNALGYGQSVSAGIISALDREVNIQDDSGTVITNHLIQTDAAVNPGNSGGALLDMNGRVIGIVSAKCSSTDVEGMGYAIPISWAASIIDQLITAEVVDESESSYLGIAGIDVDSTYSQQYDVPQGVYIMQVVEGSAAEKAGLSKRDVITKFNGRTVTSMKEIQSMMQYLKAGTEVEIVVAQFSTDYEETTMKVTLGKKTD